MLDTDVGVTSVNVTGRLQSVLKKMGGGRELSALFDQALVSGANFLTNVILARSLGVREFGIYALAWMAVLFVNSLQWALIISPMMTVGPKQEPADRPVYYGSVLMQQIVYAVLASLAIVLVSETISVRFPQWDFHGLALPLGFAAFSYLLQEFARRYLFSVRKSKLALSCDMISYLTQLPIILVMSRGSHFSARGALWVIGATSAAGFVAGLYWLEPIKFKLRSIHETFLRHWKISRWLVPSAVMQWSSGYLFIVAAPIYYGTAAAGVLRATQNVVGVAHIWFLGLDNVVPAEAARIMHRTGPDACARYIRQILVRWGTITVLFLGTIALFPEFFLKILYGAKYSGYGHILQLYAAVYLIVFFGGPLRSGLQALEYTAPVFWAYLAMTVFSIAFASPFAKDLGLAGVMAGIFATQVIFQTIVGFSFFRRVRYLRQELIANPVGTV